MWRGVSIAGASALAFTPQTHPFRTSRHTKLARSIDATAALIAEGLRSAQVRKGLDAARRGERGEVRPLRVGARETSVPVVPQRSEPCGRHLAAIGCGGVEEPLKEERRCDRQVLPHRGRRARTLG